MYYVGEMPNRCFLYVIRIKGGSMLEFSELVNVPRKKQLSILIYGDGMIRFIGRNPSATEMEHYSRIAEDIGKRTRLVNHKRMFMWG